jgi:hypothetical protein
MQRSSLTLHTHWTVKRDVPIILNRFITQLARYRALNVQSDLSELVGSRDKSSNIDYVPSVVLLHTGLNF